MKKIIGVIILYYFNIFCTECFAQDALSNKDTIKWSQSRIDIDYSFVLGFSGSVSHNFWKKQYLGFRIGAGWTFGYALKNYSQNISPAFAEFARLDLFYNYNFSNHFQFDSGIRGAALMMPVAGDDPAILGRIGIYLQPMLGWSHLKFGSLVFSSINVELNPIYFYVFCVRGSITL